MKKNIKLVFLFTLVVSFVVACVPGESTALINDKRIKEAAAITGEKPAWEVEWDKTLSLAKKEGRVSLYTWLGPTLTRALAEGFFNKYGLEVVLTTASGSELETKITQERKAGLYLVDNVLVGGAERLKWFGLTDPLEPELLLPEVTDASKWLGGKLPWVDKEHFILAPGLAPGSAIAVNTDLVKTGEIKSYKDILQPKWKGKITMLTPIRDGWSNRWFSSVLYFNILDLDYMKQLIKQDLFFTSDKRLNVEWVAMGKKSIVLAPAFESVSLFLDAGAKLDLINPVEGNIETTGSNKLVAIKNRPHPNASKLFINWYLSREGQQLVADLDARQGTRLDINWDKIPPLKLRKSGINYANTEYEDFLRIREEKYNPLALELFGPLIR